MGACYSLNDLVRVVDGCFNGDRGSCIRKIMEIVGLNRKSVLWVLNSVGKDNVDLAKIARGLLFKRKMMFFYESDSLLNMKFRWFLNEWFERWRENGYWICDGYLVLDPVRWREFVSRYMVDEPMLLLDCLKRSDVDYCLKWFGFEIFDSGEKKVMKGGK